LQGTSPWWIRLIILILKAWFYIYDCLNYIPYELFNSPAAKLQRSSRIKARPVKDVDGPWRHVEGLVHEDFPGQNTINKLFKHVTEMYEDREMLGTRELLNVHEQEQPDGRIFEQWELGDYHWQTYREVYDRAGYIAAGIKSITDSKSKIVIFAETRADWLITAFACFRANVTIVTAIAQAINETSSTVLVTSAELLPKVAKFCPKCSTLKSLVYFPLVNKKKKLVGLEPLRQQFDQILSLSELEHRSSEPLISSTATKDDVALIMYTSGTTGAAKGVMLTHENIVSSAAGLGLGVGIITDTDTFIGYLPLAHIFELAAELVCLRHGCKIGYSSPLTLHDRGAKIQPGTHGDCYALRPTLMSAVPAIMDRIFKAVSDEVASTPRFMQELFKLNYERKRARYTEGYCSPFLDRIVFKKIRRLLGGKLKGVLSGGAALNPETQRFMNICMCCPVIQGYGLTETCAAGSISEVSDLSTGAVGPPIRCSQIILKEWEEGGYSPFNDPPQGEILIGGPNVSIGYYKQPEKTAESFIEIDGVRYFATGDIGEMRDDGSLMIIDRKKDLVKLQHGEYISLAKVETALLTCPLVDNVCVYGCQLESYVIALIVPNQKYLEKLGEEIGVNTSDWSKLCAQKEVVDEFKRRLVAHAVKNNLAKAEIPGKIYLCDEPWTSESGLLTEALKLKRRPLKEKYESVIVQLYGSNGNGKK
uniref:long-chain-fatty-acid--CoA ligase n=1 Tax=Syphacia muris TaxID=451379 RepID=A0A0N5AK34_9BILA